MEKYEEIDQLVKEVIADDETITLTGRIEEALWIIGDGIMLDGQFDMGARGADHRMIEVFVEGVDRYDGGVFWEKVHKELDAVRLAPEEGVALVIEGQEIGPKTEELLKASGFRIETY